MTTQSCVFCRIRDGDIPSTRLHDDDDIFAIRDISPKAPTHLLVIPKKHIPTVADLTDEDLSLMARLTAVANTLAEQEGIARSGYRLVINNGPDSGMEVSHLHLHVLGGRPLGAMG